MRLWQHLYSTWLYQVIQILVGCRHIGIHGWMHRYLRLKIIHSQFRTHEIFFFHKFWLRSKTEILGRDMFFWQYSFFTDSMGAIWNHRWIIDLANTSAFTSLSQIFWSGSSIATSNNLDWSYGQNIVSWFIGYPSRFTQYVEALTLSYKCREIDQALLSQFSLLSEFFIGKVPARDRKDWTWLNLHRTILAVGLFKARRSWRT